MDKKQMFKSDTSIPHSKKRKYDEFKGNTLLKNEYDNDMDLLISPDFNMDEFISPIH